MELTKIKLYVTIKLLYNKRFKLKLYVFCICTKVNQISKELCYYKFYSQYNDLTNHHIHNENSVIQTLLVESLLNSFYIILPNTICHNRGLNWTIVSLDISNSFPYAWFVLSYLVSFLSVFLSSNLIE